jgi:uncharacterized protein HemX
VPSAEDEAELPPAAAAAARRAVRSLMSLVILLPGVLLLALAFYHRHVSRNYLAPAQAETLRQERDTARNEADALRQELERLKGGQAPR